MVWSRVTTELASLYGTAAAWVYDNPVETDVIIGLIVAGSLFVLTKRARRMQRRAHRLLWGALMKRKDRGKYHAMKLEDAILDACMEMVNQGDMTPEEEKTKLTQMCKSYNLTGLMPGKDQASVKRGINFRLLRGWFSKNKPGIPGDKPGGATDPNYKPEFEVARRGLTTSKYATET